jgi:putative transcriptional regulator
MTKLSRIDILLLKYAAGSLGGTRFVAVVVLLSLSSSARRRVEEFEALGGQLIQEESPAPLSVDSLKIVLGRIDAPPPPETSLSRLLRLFLRS